MRRTAAERRAEAEVLFKASEAARVARETVEYMPRLMAAFERANTHNYELKVRDGMFTLRDRDAEYRYHEAPSFTPAYSEASYKELENLEFDLNEKDEELAEARRRVEVKKEAERKVRELLSDEERELLGL